MTGSRFPVLSPGDINLFMVSGLFSTIHNRWHPTLASCYWI